MIDEIIVFAGGHHNIVKVDHFEENISVIVKDVGLIDLSHILLMEQVEKAEIKRNRLLITLKIDQEEKEKRMIKNLKIAEEVLKGVGGEGNVNKVFHCATRLRFNLKDEKKVDEVYLKGIDGVVGVSSAGGMFMVIVGQNVEEVYNHLCSIGNFTKSSAIDENLDGALADKNIPAWKRVGNSILTYIISSMTPLIPVIVGVSLWKTIGLLIGPEMLNLVAADSDFYITCNFMYNVLFYFLPIYLGYTAAKSLNTNPVWGIFIGALIIVPDFMAMVGVRETFGVFGVPAPVASYAQSFLPVILGVWILSYVYKWVNKLVPTVLSTLFTPLIIIFIMSIVMFVVCAPIGNYVGNLLSTVFITLNNSAAPIRITAQVILCAILPFMLLCGMHVAIYLAVYVAAIPVGYEAFVLPAFVACSFVYYGLALGAAIKFKKKENKSLAIGYFITGFIGSISEPILYGIVLKSKKNIIVTCASCGIVGLLLGILQPKAALLGNVSILSLIPYFTVEGSGNLMLGLAITAIAFIVAMVGIIMFGDMAENEN